MNSPTPTNMKNNPLHSAGCKLPAHPEIAKMDPTKKKAPRPTEEYLLLLVNFSCDISTTFKMSATDIHERGRAVA